MEKIEQREKQFVIGEASPGDAEGIGLVQAETWRATYPNEAAGITREDVEALIATRLPKSGEHWRGVIEGTSGDRRVWVAKDEEQKVVGFSSGQKSDEENKINAIYVLPDIQRGGIGQGLMKEALGWLGADKPVTLSVAKYNDPAIAFYKKLGFEEAGDVPSAEATKLPSGKEISVIKMIKLPSKE